MKTGIFAGVDTGVSCECLELVGLFVVGILLLAVVGQRQLRCCCVSVVVQGLVLSRPPWRRDMREKRSLLTSSGSLWLWLAS